LYQIIKYYNLNIYVQNPKIMAFSGTQKSKTVTGSELAEQVTSFKYLGHEITYCNVLGVLYSRWNFIALQKSIHYS
jgi:hypothetical protein